jgi:hypothetical protein
MLDPYYKDSPLLHRVTGLDPGRVTSKNRGDFLKTVVQQKFRHTGA